MVKTAGYFGELRIEMGVLAPQELELADRMGGSIRLSVEAALFLTGYLLPGKHEI
jgi:hypothetical protein